MIQLTVVSSFQATAAAATSMPIYPPPTTTNFFAFSYKARTNLYESLKQAMLSKDNRKSREDENEAYALSFFFGQCLWYLIDFKKNLQTPRKLYEQI